MTSKRQELEDLREARRVEAAAIANYRVAVANNASDEEQSNAAQAAKALRKARQAAEYDYRPSKTGLTGDEKTKLAAEKRKEEKKAKEDAKARDGQPSE